jgi:hypothetical protein
LTAPEIFVTESVVSKNTPPVLQHFHRVVGHGISGVRLGKDKTSYRNWK